MDKLTLLRTLRDEVAEPSSEQLSPALNKLERSFHSAKPRKHAPRARIVFAVVAGASVLMLAAGNVHLSAQSAQASTILRDAAALSIKYSDVTSGPGEYLLARTHANWAIDVGDGEMRMNEQRIDVYMPSDPTQDWVLDRDWGDASPPDELIAAENGVFYSDPWVEEDYASLPTGARELFEYFDSRYSGGSASRDENNFERIVQVLGSGLVPADLRAGLYGALTLIPGVTSTADVANLDGMTGTAIGRTEVLRAGLRHEIIIDPNTGLVIGEREISTRAIFGFGLNEVMWLTAIETTVVSTAPRP
jgi:hypothetical protein